MKILLLPVFFSTLVASACVNPATTGAATTGTVRRPSADAAHASAVNGIPVRGKRVDDDPKDPVLCEDEVDPLTRMSMFKYKICLHKSEWDAIADKHQRDFHDLIKNGWDPTQP